MERTLQSGNFITRDLFLVVVFAAYVSGAFIPLWWQGGGTIAAPIWTALLAALLGAGLWRLLRPGGSYPGTDLGFIIPLVLAVNLFSTLLGRDKNWLQPMDFLVVALCALYYPLGFNLAVAGLIFGLECVNFFFTYGRTGVEGLVNLALFGAYLAGAALILGRIFQSERRKKERALKAVKRLQEGALNLSPDDAGDPSMRSISPDGRANRLLNSARLLDDVLTDLLATAKAAFSSENALLFMSQGGGESVYLRVHIGGDGVVEDCSIPAGQGLVGWVAKEKRAMLVREDARGLSYLKDEGTAHSFVAAPILNGGYIEGVIALDSPQKEAFSESDKEALTRFAGIAAYLLQNAREYQQVDLTAKNFEALHRISSEVSSSLDTADILESLARLCRDIVPYDYLTAAFLEDDGSAVFQTAKGYDGLTIPPGPVQLAGSLLGWIVENRQPLSFCDLDQRTERLPIFPVKEMQTNCRSFLGIPFMSRDKVLGVFTLALRQPDAISAYQQHMLSIIANQAAVNIANARLHQMMSRMATTDGLTGLINHRHFQERTDAEFQRAARYPEPLSILLMDIDHFKKVNDSYGHPVGDAVLKRVAKILRETVRAADIVARYGGEEFVALLLNTDEKGARMMAERIRTAIEKSRFMLEGKRVPVTVSVGCACYPADAAGKKDLIEKADQAMYWAKGHGRNQCCLYSSQAGAETAKKD